MPSAFPLPPEVFWVLAVSAFAFGCCAGSYLNVVIYRLPLGLSTNNPRRSFCPSCRYLIPWYHNIPVFSWLALRGRCANCKAEISPRYPIVELLTGILFLAAFARFGFEWRTLAAFTFLGLAVAGSYIDIDHLILPHEITWGGAAAGLAFSWLVPDFLTDGPRWLNFLHALGSAAFGYGLIWLIIQFGKKAFGKLKMDFEEPAEWSIRQDEGDPEPVFRVAEEQEVWSEIFSRKSDRLVIRATRAKVDDREFEEAVFTLSEDRVVIQPAQGERVELPLEEVNAMSGRCVAVEQPREAMGMGDANWMACVGAFMGWKAVLFSVFAGSLIGALISVSMILLGRREWAGRIPFGPYLAAGAVIFLFRGPELVEWYMALQAGGVDFHAP